MFLSSLLTPPAAATAAAAECYSALKTQLNVQVSKAAVVRIVYTV